MKSLLAALAVTLLPAAAFAGYSGPGVESCRSYAEREVRKQNPKVERLSLDQDADLQIERYTQKVGSQFVSSLLHGNGAILYAGGVSVEFRFLCQLADDKRAVFFYWEPRRDAPALAQCRRSGRAAADCLQAQLEIAERALTEVYAKHYTDALQAGGEKNADKFRRSAETWKAYRDAECGRRNSTEEQKACVIALTRQRAIDLR